MQYYGTDWMGTVLGLALPGPTAPHGLHPANPGLGLLGILWRNSWYARRRDRERGGHSIELQRGLRVDAE